MHERRFVWFKEGCRKGHSEILGPSEEVDTPDTFSCLNAMTMSGSLYTGEDVVHSVDQDFLAGSGVSLKPGYWKSVESKIRSSF